MTTITEVTPAARAGEDPQLFIDLTRKCQLSCTHCYNASGPEGTHGTVNRKQWTGLLDQAAGNGIARVTFIGGEPTLHPDFASLLSYALEIGLKAETYSNLVHITDGHWTLFQRSGASLATSYYSSRSEEHNAVTRRPSHRRTLANIRKALELGVPLRVGVVETGDPAVTAAAVDHLTQLGVHRVRVDHVRPFGRGNGGRAPEPSGLCGRCGNGRLAVAPDGNVSPCVFSTWMSVGNILTTPLSDILHGPAMAEAGATIRQAIGPDHGCDPNCDPNDECTPGYPGSECTPRN